MMNIAIVWQRFLPYHVARIHKAWERLNPLALHLTAIEVSSRDRAYGFPEVGEKFEFEQVCCFQDRTYHDLKAKEVYRRVLEVLLEKNPDLVFAPATAFPEGMAAFAYRLIRHKKAVLMDDAWEHTDRRGTLTRAVKRLIHRNVDAAFIPGESHRPYFQKMGFPEERIVFGIDGIDNDTFSREAQKARQREESGSVRTLDRPYFLYVGRFLPRKGIETLIEAYRTYRREANGNGWDLVLVGSGDPLSPVKEMAQSAPGIHFAGPRFGEDLYRFYGLAQALIVPSLSDPWGLVVNEGMASGLPVLVSRGCGAANLLVREGENGWTFAPGDIGALSALMERIAGFPANQLRKMGERSRAIISEWSLDRFADGVLAAVDIPRRPPAGFLADLATKLWKGRVSVT